MPNRQARIIESTGFLIELTQMPFVFDEKPDAPGIMKLAILKNAIFMQIKGNFFLLQSTASLPPQTNANAL